MGIRVNPNVYGVLLQGLQLTTQQEDQALEQISSGQQINSLSDNPSGAATLVNLRLQAGVDTQYLQNISTLNGSLNVANSALSSVVEALTTAQSAGEQGTDATLSASNRQALAQQVQGIQQQILGLANTAYNGQYLFSGTATTTQPYAANGASPSGVTYSGDSNINSVDISQGVSMPINLPGSQIFSNSSGDAFQALQDLSNALNTNGNIEGAVTEVQAAISSVSTQQTFYGNSLQRLDNAQTFLTQQQTTLTETQSDALGANIATSISNMVQAETARQALVEAGGQVSQTNLFDYLPTF